MHRGIKYNRICCGESMVNSQITNHFLFSSQNVVRKGVMIDSISGKSSSPSSISSKRKSNLFNKDKFF